MRPFKCALRACPGVPGVQAEKEIRSGRTAPPDRKKSYQAAHGGSCLPVTKNEHLPAGSHETADRCTRGCTLCAGAHVPEGRGAAAGGGGPR